MDLLKCMSQQTHSTVGGLVLARSSYFLLMFLKKYIVLEVVFGNFWALEVESLWIAFI